MKIAIQGHPTRGKEVIQLLESLGSKNNCSLKGDYEDLYYYIDTNVNRRICCHDFDYINSCKKYTLEEFEEEFPFKVGDKVITTNGIIGIIDKFKPEEDYPYCIRTYDGIFYWCVTSTLKPYKEMKEERNITLTLEKAKEWYKKGGELKEIALQAFSENELTKVDLPKTWEEFCKNYPRKIGDAFIDTLSIIFCNDKDGINRNTYRDKNVCPSKKSAEAHLAMIQLEQLRDCWRQGWKPTSGESCYAIKLGFRGLDVYCFYTVEFLSFPTREMAEEFLKCFRDLIKKAGDLI